MRTIGKTLGALMLSVCCATAQAAETATASHAPGVYLRPLSARHGTQYALLVPPDYSETAKQTWPLIVALHYSTGNGNDYLSHWQAEAERRHYFILAPDARDPKQWSDADAVDVLATLRRLCAEFKIDRTRILVAGTSAGGNFTYLLASRAPTWFKAAAPIAADTAAHWWSDASPGADFALRKVRFCVVHGAQDQRIPVRRARDSTLFLRQHGIRVHVMILPGDDHYSIAPYRQILDWFESL